MYLLLAWVSAMADFLRMLFSIIKLDKLGPYRVYIAVAGLVLSGVSCLIARNYDCATASFLAALGLLGLTPPKPPVDDTPTVDIPGITKPTF